MSNRATASFVPPPICRAPGSTPVPEQQEADRETLVHRVQQVPDLGGLPDERPLDVRQRDLAAADGLHEPNAEYVVSLNSVVPYRPRRSQPVLFSSIQTNAWRIELRSHKHAGHSL